MTRLTLLLIGLSLAIDVYVIATGRANVLTVLAVILTAWYARLLINREREANR